MRSLPSSRCVIIASGSAVATLLGVSFWIVLPSAALVYFLATTGRGAWAIAVIGTSAAIALLAHQQEIAVAPGAAVATDGSVELGLLFMAGLKAGLLTFGGAYAAIPFVREDAVGRGWVSDGQFLDGLALSGIIPAPLIMFTTFVGFQAGGLGGALAITIGVFLPAFAFGMAFFDGLERDR